VNNFGGPQEPTLKYLAVEVSYGSQWVDLNDGEKYKISAEGTRDQTQKTWRRFSAQSPVLGGDYLIHAVPEMVRENLSVWVYGQDQTDLADNIFFLDELFEQLDYRIRWTTDEYREYWRCQLADGTSSRNHVWTHSLMAVSSFQVPRYPNVTRERVA
jgi:hypothetical protein